MKLRSSLTVMLLACGLTPLVLATVFNYYVASNNMDQISSVSKDQLVDNAKQLLAAVQQSKADRVESLMSAISDQAISFSKNPATIQACQDFTESFGQADFIKNVTPQQMEQVDAALEEYYANQFGENYKTENDGKLIPPKTLLSKLNQTSKLMQYEYIAANPNPLGEKDKMFSPDTPSQYNSLHAKYHPAFRDFLNRFGYYDIFICDIDGRIVYSVYKELDYGTSLNEGPYSQSNLAAVFRQTISLGDEEFALSDFRPYTPSYEAPAAFTGSPIVKDGKTIGAAIFQIPVAKVNDVMIDRTGLGDGGESYLVGPDSIMRSDSYLDPDHRSLANAFKNPAEGKVQTEAAKLAVAGQQGFLTDSTNYLGEKVLSQYGQVSLGGLTWGIITEMPYSEAMSSVIELEKHRESSNFWYVVFNGIGVLAVAATVGGLAYYLAGRIVGPIQSVVQVTHSIANGNLCDRLPVNRTDEIGEMSAALNTAMDKLSDSIGRISKSAQTLNGASRTMTSEASALSNDVTASRSRSQHVAASSQELSGTIRGMSESAEMMTSSMRTVAASVEEMTQTISEIASNAERSANVAKEASELATVSNEQISDLGSAADEIGKVIEVIQDIAEQTNLLALNATIEAARAGEAGKGFAVVATEVKELAKQTGAATDDIRQRIEGIQHSTGKAVASIREISEVVAKVNMVASTIASAVEEQNVTTKEMARHIAETAQSAEGVSNAVNSTSRATEDISTSIGEVDEVIGRTVIAANGSEQQGSQLLMMAEEMLQLVNQFKLTDSSRQKV